MAKQPPQSNIGKDKDDDSWGKLATDLLGIQFDSNDDDFDLPDEDAPISKPASAPTTAMIVESSSDGEVEPNLSFDEEDVTAGGSTTEVEPPPMDLEEKRDPRAESEKDIWDLLESWNWDEPAKDQPKARSSESGTSGDRSRRREESREAKRSDEKSGRSRGRDEQSREGRQERVREVASRPAVESEEFFDFDEAPRGEVSKQVDETAISGSGGAERSKSDRPRRERVREERTRDGRSGREDRPAKSEKTREERAVREEQVREDKPSRKEPRQHREDADAPRRSGSRRDSSERPSRENRSSESSARDEVTPREERPRREPTSQRSDAKDARPTRSLAAPSSGDGFGDGLEEESSSRQRPKSSGESKEALASRKASNSGGGKPAPRTASTNEVDDDFADDLFREFAIDDEEVSGDVDDADGVTSQAESDDDGEERRPRRRRRRRRGRRGGRSEAVSESRLDVREGEADEDGDNFEAEASAVEHAESETEESGDVADDVDAPQEDEEKGQRSKRRRRRTRRRGGDQSASVFKTEFNEVGANEDDDAPHGEAESRLETKPVDDEPVVRVSYEGIPSWEEAISYLVRSRGPDSRGRGRNGSGNRR